MKEKESDNNKPEIIYKHIDPENPMVEILRNSISESLNSGEIEKAKEIFSLMCEIEDRKVKLLNSRQTNRIALIKQFLNILIGVSLIPIGVYIIVAHDSLSGYFLTGSGFSAIGISGLISSETLQIIKKRNNNE